MKEKYKSILEGRLQAWKVSLDPDPGLGSKVLQRARESASRDAFFSPLRSRMRFISHVAVAAAILLGVFFVSQWMERARIRNELGYTMLIDPVYRVQALDGIAGRPSVDTGRDRFIERLAWMQDRLDLSSDQFLQLVQLHQDYADRFDRIYEELLLVQREYGEFEQLRQDSDQIDFIALYDVLTERNDLEDNAHSLSSELISRALSILNPVQRKAYLSVVQRIPDSARNG